MSNKCKICGVSISPRKTYCSRVCRNKSYYSSKRIEKVCPSCKKVFIGTIKQKYCSDKCIKISQRRYKKTCPICNKTFKARGNGTYCSNSCYRKANSEKHGLKNVICIVCNKEFRALPADSKNPICSESCKSNLINKLVENSLNKLKSRGDKSDGK